MQDLILKLKVFGTAGIKTRTLMSGYSIHWQHHIVTNHYLLSTVNKNKKRNVHNYEDRMIQVEHGCFSPLVFTTAGGLSPITNVVYKRLASLISRKQNTSYNKTIFWIRCKLGFALIRSAIQCLRGSRNSLSYYHDSVDFNITLALCEGNPSA